MRAEKRGTKDKPYWTIQYYEDGKRKRLPVKDGYKYFSEQECQKEIKKIERDYGLQKILAKERLQWETKYHEKRELIDAFERYQSDKGRAPNTYKSSVTYLQYYIYPFFMGKKSQGFSNEPRLALWSRHFEDFKIWLNTKAKTIKKSGKDNKPISLSTQNHIIRTLNVFMDFCSKRGELKQEHYYKLKAHEKSLLGERGANDLIDKEEFKKVYKRLLKKSKQEKDVKSLKYRDAAYFYALLYWSGMRFNEAFGLSIDDIYTSKAIKDSTIARDLEHYKIDSYGFILINSQPALKTRYDSENPNCKKVPRKALKGKKSIKDKDMRNIPIINSECWDNIVELYLEAKESHENQVLDTENKKDYLLFQNATHSDLNRYLKETQLELQSEGSIDRHFRTYHCARHTRATEIIGSTRSFFLAKSWLGHAREETTMRYIHIFERDAQKATQEASEIKFSNGKRKRA